MNSNEVKKHAYLILAHEDNLTLRTLVGLIDDQQNDIFIHMEKKNKSYDPGYIEKIPQKSKVYHSDRIKVSWGGYSVIEAELMLLKLAVEKGKYLYYHLLSGQDLPIKSMKDIRSFFDYNQGKEFVRFQDSVYHYQYRTKYFYFLQEAVGRNGSSVFQTIDKISVKIQKVLHVQRNKNVVFQKGTQWFSITDELARYVLEKAEWIKKVFKYTLCCDELFLQTIISNSRFQERLFHKEFDDDLEAIMRLIDWERGNPYVFRKEDYEDIIKCKFLFARKFDEKIDREIIYRIRDSLKP